MSEEDPPIRSSDAPNNTNFSSLFPLEVDAEDAPASSSGGGLFGFGQSPNRGQRMTQTRRTTVNAEDDDEDDAAIDAAIDAERATHGGTPARRASLSSGGPLAGKPMLDPSRRRLGRGKIQRVLEDTRDRMFGAHSVHYYWFLLILLACLVSVSSWLVDIAAEIIHDALIIVLKPRQTASNVAAYLGLRVVIVLVAAEMTKRVSPMAAGSGICETKSILAGFQVKGFLSKPTLAAKLIGVVMLLGAGLPVGKEGPFIHSSVCIAEALVRMKFFQMLNDTPEFRMHVLSAAAACGVSSAFNAPIGGIMFSIEAAGQFYVTSHYWGAFLCASMGAFLTRELKYTSLQVYAPKFKKMPYKHWELPIFFILAIVGGVVGGVFVKLMVVLIKTRKRCAAIQVPPLPHFGHRSEEERPLRWRLYASSQTVFLWSIKSLVGGRYGFSAFTALVTGTFAVAVGGFMHMNVRDVLDDLFSPNSLSNDNLHENWLTDINNVVSALVIFLACLITGALMDSQLPISNGMLTPSFAIGAGIGRLFGELVTTIAFAIKRMNGDHGPHNPMSAAGGYAIVGAAAYTVAATGKLSMGVMVCEVAGELGYIIPVLMASVVGQAFGHLVEIDMYHMISKMKHEPHWPKCNSVRDFPLSVRDVFDEELAANKPKAIPFRSKFPVDEDVSTRRQRRFRQQDDERLDHDAHMMLPNRNEETALEAVQTKREEIQAALDSTHHSLLAVVADPDSMILVGAVRAVDLEVLLETTDADRIDLRKAGIDYTWPRVSLGASLNYVCFTFALYQCSRVFVVENSTLLGSIDASMVERAFQQQHSDEDPSEDHDHPNDNASSGPLFGSRTAASDNSGERRSRYNEEVEINPITTRTSAENQSSIAMAI